VAVVGSWTGGTRGGHSGMATDKRLVGRRRESRIPGRSKKQLGMEQVEENDSGMAWWRFRPGFTRAKADGKYHPIGQTVVCGSFGQRKVVRKREEREVSQTEGRLAKLIDVLCVRTRGFAQGFAPLAPRPLEKHVRRGSFCDP